MVNSRRIDLGRGDVGGFAAGGVVAHFAVGNAFAALLVLEKSDNSHGYS